jgi:hypothetical protein
MIAAALHRPSSAKLRSCHDRPATLLTRKQPNGVPGRPAALADCEMNVQNMSSTFMQLQSCSVTTLLFDILRYRLQAAK